jgi:hypothetical protein
MQAHEDALPGDNTALVLTPGSAFFEYFGESGAARK